MPRGKNNPDTDTTIRISREAHEQATKLAEDFAYHGVKQAVTAALSFAMSEQERFAEYAMRTRVPARIQGVYVDPREAVNIDERYAKAILAKLGVNPSRTSFTYEDHKGEVRSAPMASEPVADPELDALLADILG